MVVAHLDMGVYELFHRWLGRHQLEGTWTAWKAGDRKAALAAIPDDAIAGLALPWPAA